MTTELKLTWEPVYGSIDEYETEFSGRRFLLSAEEDESGWTLYDADAGEQIADFGRVTRYVATCLANEKILDAEVKR